MKWWWNVTYAETGLVRLHWYLLMGASSKALKGNRKITAYLQKHGTFMVYMVHQTLWDYACCIQWQKLINKDYHQMHKIIIKCTHLHGWYMHGQKLCRCQNLALMILCIKRGALFVRELLGFIERHIEEAILKIYKSKFWKIL